MGEIPRYVEALLHPEAYRHPVDDIRLHETHISWVVLAGRRAYKVKKPVDLGFLDFTTTARRAAVCADEVRLNRRLCRGVYLGVGQIVPCGQGYVVVGPDGRRGPDGARGADAPGEPVVCMRRLPAEGMLDHLLARGAADAALVRRVARRLARFHAGATTGPGVDEHGSLATIRQNWAENFAQTRPYIGRTIPRGAHATLVTFVERFLSREARLFAQRAAAGRIRDGHGDLHAASICVEGRRLHLFDCIEFNDRFRCADVAAEVAFLAMDLDHHGRADLSAAFVDAYVDASGDDELRQLLDFYKCYRAYVRGKVTSFRLDEPGLPEAEAGTLEAAARSYFGLALTYATGQARPVLVVTMGLPASGKTTLARGLAGHAGLVHLSSDVVRKELAGLESTTRRPEAFGQGLYAPAMTRRTYAALHRRAGRWLRAGRSAVLDATYSRARERRAVSRLAARLGAPLVVLVCRGDEAVLRARLAARATDPMASSDARLDLWPALRAAFEEPVAFPGAGACVPLPTTGPPAAVLEEALAVVRTHGGATGSVAAAKAA